MITLRLRFLLPNVLIPNLVSPLSSLLFLIQLHVFAKTSTGSFSKVHVADCSDVGDLKSTLISYLRVDSSPDRVRLYREAEGSTTPVLLDIREKLADEGVFSGTSIILEVIAPDTSAVSPAESAAFDNITNLYSSLLVAEVEPIPSSSSGLIKLPKGVLWPQLGAEPLFVRDFYQGLYEGPLESLDPSCKSKTRKFIVRGNEGIGKSAFGAYLLWRAVKAGRTVVYTSDKMRASFVFHSNGHVETFGTQDFERRTWNVLEHASTVFICDGILPPVVNAFTVLITSPKRERYKEFFKLVDCRMLTVPVFFRHEVKDMLYTCFPQLVPQETFVWERYQKWGGIVRYVLGRLDVDSQEELASSFTAINLEELFFHLGARAIESEISVSHRLLHLKPIGEGAFGFENSKDVDSYALSRTELASPYVKERVYKDMKKRHYQRLYQVLAQPYNASYSKLYGDLYEVGAIRRLLNGGTFSSFDCSIGIEGKTVIPRSKRHSFSSAEDLRRLRLSHEGGQPNMYVPDRSTFTAVDAVLPGNILVNFTVNVKHELKMYGAENKSSEGAVPVADALGVSGDIVFYWVLPEEGYRKACKAGKPFPVTGQRLTDPPRKVKQFFVCVPFKFMSTKGLEEES